MLPSSDNYPKNSERRAHERQSCRPSLLCLVIDPLDESISWARPWNVSTGGMCVLIEPYYPPGTRLEVEFRGQRSEAPPHLFAKVVHTLLVPSFREMWLTGCSFQGESLGKDLLTSASDPGALG